jgi:hypothetical protein
MTQENCSTCGGNGSIPCPACGGSHKDMNFKEWESCAACRGHGSITCPDCGGSGKR